MELVQSSPSQILIPGSIGSLWKACAILAQALGSLNAGGTSIAITRKTAEKVSAGWEEIERKKRRARYVNFQFNPSKDATIMLIR